MVSIRLWASAGQVPFEQPLWVESGGSGNADRIHNGSEHPVSPAMLAGDATAQAVARQGSSTVARSIAGVAEGFYPRVEASARWTTSIAGQGTQTRVLVRRLQKDQADPRRAGDIGIAGSFRPNERCRFVIRISLSTKRISGGASDGISSRRPPSGSLRLPCAVPMLDRRRSRQWHLRFDAGVAHRQRQYRRRGHEWAHRRHGL